MCFTDSFEGINSLSVTLPAWHISKGPEKNVHKMKALHLGGEGGGGRGNLLNLHDLSETAFSDDLQ